MTAALGGGVGWTAGGAGGGWMATAWLPASRSTSSMLAAICSAVRALNSCPPVTCGRHAIAVASPGFRPRPTTCATIPARRSSSAAAHTFCWQLSASSWMRIRLRLPGAGGSDLAASRSAVVSGPRPRGFILSRVSPRRCASKGSRGRNSSTSPQSPRRWPKATRPTRVCGPTLPRPRRTASRARTTLLAFRPSMVPAMEPEPSKTTITDAGSCARARRRRKRKGHPTCQNEPSAQVSMVVPHG